MKIYFIHLHQSPLFFFSIKDNEFKKLNYILSNLIIIIFHHGSPISIYQSHFAQSSIFTLLILCIIQFNSFLFI